MDEADQRRLDAIREYQRNIPSLGYKTNSQHDIDFLIGVIDAQQEEINGNRASQAPPSSTIGAEA